MRSFRIRMAAGIRPSIDARLAISGLQRGSFVLKITHSGCPQAKLALQICRLGAHERRISLRRPWARDFKEYPYYWVSGTMIMEYQDMLLRSYEPDFIITILTSTLIDERLILSIRQGLCNP